MFELLFTRASAITRHQLAPLAEERRSFLRHLAQQSYRPRSLRSKASQLLAIVQQMNRVRGTSPAQIERATKNRRHLSRLDRRSRPGAPMPRRLSAHGNDVAPIPGVAVHHTGRDNPGARKAPSVRSVSSRGPRPFAAHDPPLWFPCIAASYASSDAKTSPRTDHGGGS